MIAKLYPEKTPGGHVLPLAKAISAASPHLGRNSIKLAADLFSGAYTEESPATVEVETAEKLPALREACADCGIAVVTEMPTDLPHLAAPPAADTLPHSNPS